MPVDPLSIALLGGSLVGQIFGMSQSAKQNRERQKAINRRRTMNDAYFNKEYYANVQDRPEVKSTMQLLADRIKQQQNLNASKAAITGASEEQQLAAGEQQAVAYDQSLKGLTENESGRKQNALNRNIEQTNMIDQQQEQLNAEKAASTANLVNNAVNLGTTAVGLMGTSKKKLLNKDQAAGVNNSVVGLASKLGGGI